MAQRYTQVPRPTLWLVQGGEVVRDGALVEVGSFYIGKATVTNQQYEAYASGYPRSPLSPSNDHPAVGVSLADALGYCEWYSQLSGKRFRLPSEAEWELACSGSATTRYFFGDDPAAADPYVWHQANSGGHCQPVESSRANPVGLHEMLGNVWQWTASGALRGGSYRTALADIGSAVRRLESPHARLDDVGFRIVRSL